MTMVDGGAAGPSSAARGHEPVAHRAGAVPVACLARPGTGLAHLEGPCQCFCGGPPPVFLDRPRELSSAVDRRRPTSSAAGGADLLP